MPELAPEQELIRETVARLAADEIAPIAARIDAEDWFPEQVFRRLGEIGPELTLATCPPADEVLAVAAVLDRLAVVSELSAEVVKLRFFAGLSHEETASALGISHARARREWAYAKAFLYRELKPRIS